jgi:hypothetical protein
VYPVTVYGVTTALIILLYAGSAIEDKSNGKEPRIDIQKKIVMGR